MRLLRCHIENFGKLNDYTMNFTDNPQVFYAPNGWGKSTLAAFIKVMFYGFAGESKRSATLEKERLRYKPWQGGVYGGELEFEVGGKRYLLNRTFGSKEAEDTFALYDGVTNLRSEDYSTAIGEELFQINQESFLRTVFLAQNACDTATTDSINAKIGNLADNLDDLNNYEKVQQVLKDLRNSMSPTRKTGSLKKQKEAIAELKDELRKAGGMETALAELEEKVVRCSEEQLRLTKERKEIQTEWEDLTRRKAVEAKRIHYDSIVRNCLEKQKLVDERLTAMGGQVPDKEKVVWLQGQLRLLQEQESEATANSLQESETEELAHLRQRFIKGVPEADTIKVAREQLMQLDHLRLEAAGKGLDEGELAEKRRLEEQLAASKVSSEEQGLHLATLEKRLDESLSGISVYMELKNGLVSKKATLSSLRAMEQQQKKQQEQQLQQKVKLLQEQLETRQKSQRAMVAVLIVGVILMAAGGALLALAKQVPGVVLLSVGAIVALLSAVMLGTGRRSQLAQQEEIRLALAGGEGIAEPGDYSVMAKEGVREQPDSSVSVLEQEIARDEEQMLKAKALVADVLTEVDGTEGEYRDQNSVWDNPLRLRDKLYDWKDALKRLQRLRAKELDYQAKGYEAQIKGLQEQVAAVLEPYCEKIGENAMSQLLMDLSEERERFLVLDERERKYQTAKTGADTYRQQAMDFLTEYNQSTVDIHESLQQLTNHLNAYEKDSVDLDRMKAEKVEFEATNDIKLLEQPLTETVGSEEELKRRMDELDEMLSSLSDQIHGYRRQLEDKQEELEELAEQREKLASAEADFAKAHLYYTRLGYVSEYLEKAKDSLSAKYIGPVLASFKRNYELIAGETGEDFRMDANIHLTKRDLGEQRETGAFSAGNQDLIHIVLRVALVDAMYEKEKPFLIIDDSFVNFDGERLETAGKFLQQIAREYQVIYFTCHESRVLTD